MGYNRAWNARKLRMKRAKREKRRLEAKKAAQETGAAPAAKS